MSESTSNSTDFILISDSQVYPSEVLEESLPLEAQVELGQEIDSDLDNEFIEVFEKEEEIKKSYLLSKKFLMIVGGAALCATALPIILGMGERSKISKTFECQKAQQVRTTQSNTETLLARFRALGVEPPPASIQTTRLSACGPGE
jgi:hypothetical protein